MSATTVSRLSGAIYAATSAHRLACEARELLRWPLETRRAYLADVERLRGKLATDQLREALRVEHALQNSSQQRRKGDTQ